jgi:excisionase family DNA binding protein
MEKLAISIEEFAKSTGIGRSKAFELSKQPGFPIVRLGRRIIIPVDALKAWLENQVEENDAL